MSALCVYLSISGIEGDEEEGWRLGMCGPSKWRCSLNALNGQAATTAALVAGPFCGIEGASAGRALFVLT